MDRDTAVTIVKRRLARFNDSVMTDYIITEMQAAQQRLEGRPEPPWFLITESAYTTTSANEERIAVPTDFLMEVEGDALWIEDTDGVRTVLKKDDYDSIRTLYSEPGTPKRYALLGNYFRLRPAPDAGYTLHMIYYGSDDVLSTNMENQWLKYMPEILIAETGFVIASQYIMNAAAAAKFASDVQVATGQLRAMNQARLDANRIYGSDN